MAAGVPEIVHVLLLEQVKGSLSPLPVAVQLIWRFEVAPMQEIIFDDESTLHELTDSVVETTVENEVAAACEEGVKVVPPKSAKLEQLNGDALVPVPAQVVQLPVALAALVSVQSKDVPKRGLLQVTVSVAVPLDAVAFVPGDMLLGVPLPENAAKVEQR